MSWLIFLSFLTAASGTSPAAEDTAVAAEVDLQHEPPTILVVVGAGGLPEYTDQFSEWADRWQQAADQAGARHLEIGRLDEQDATDRQQLEQMLAAQSGAGDSPLWLVVIGHGTFYRNTAKFNLRGPDFSSQELAQWLAPLTRPVIVVNCASSSGPFIRDLAGPNRIIVTATRSGAEQNYARFGDYMSQAIQDPSADLDHDKQVSLLEAFLSASRQVAKFYEEESRLATEHALLEDNGDGLGTPATFYRGVRVTAKSRDEAPVDGDRAARLVLVASDIDRGFTAEQLERRAAIEQEIDQLRQMKSELDEEVYYERLEELMIRLAQLYDEVEAAQEQEASQPQQDAH